MNVCLDACFLIGLYDPRDQFHARARNLFVEHFEQPSRNVAIIVWPVLYEAVSTRMAKNQRRLDEMGRELKILELSKRLDYLTDIPYRDQAVDECFYQSSQPRNKYRALSLTDRVLRGALSDTDARIDAILTFNEGDFSDICKKFNKALLS